MVSVLALLVSCICLYFLLKKNTTPPQEIADFKEYAEQIIVEFNRVATRNISMLDDKIEDLEHKIRLCHKMDILLKERFEEADQVELFKGLDLAELYKQQTQQLLNEKDRIFQDIATENEIVPESKPEPKVSKTTKPNLKKQIEHPQNIEKELPISQESGQLFDPSDEEILFKNLPTEKKQQLLLQYLKEGKSKTELIDLGFSTQEINMAQLVSHVNES